VRQLVFPGSFDDGHGSEDLTWRITPSGRPGYKGRYEIWTRIRGVAVWGVDFDGLEPADTADTPGSAGTPGSADAVAAGLPLNAAGEIGDCVLTGDLPCVASTRDRQAPITVRFVLDLRHDPPRPAGSPRNLTLTATVDGMQYTVVDDWFEDGTLRLDQAMQPQHRLRCCVTCLYSDYSPAGHGLLGIRCHRDAREQYLQVRSKADYWPVPVTEEVPETYLCDEYEPRVPGTGYRG
jgi:hypothetical protein